MRNRDGDVNPIAVTALVVVLSVVSIAVVLALIAGIWAGWSAMSRFQNIADAHNTVQVNDIRIAQTEQLVEVEKQKALIRIADAEGIAKAQAIISGSLTQPYLEYLAIQAQQEMATHDHTATIYIPVGPNGIPITATQPVNGR